MDKTEIWYDTELEGQLKQALEEANREKVRAVIDDAYARGELLGVKKTMPTVIAVALMSFATGAILASVACNSRKSTDSVPKKK